MTKGESVSDATPPISPLDQEGIFKAVTAAKTDFAAAQSLEELKRARTAHLGENSPIILANRAIRNLDKSDKAQAGKNLGGAKKQLHSAYDERCCVLEKKKEAQTLEAEALDVTQPVARYPLGARHPLETLMEDISDFFVSMGWEIAEGPEVEHEWFNFDSLNIDPDHPARREQDTLYIDGRSLGAETSGEGNLVLRTHTSPVQARVMLGRGVPVYIASIPNMDCAK